MRPTERFTRAAARLGLTTDQLRDARHARAAPHACAWTALALSARLAYPNRLAFITGPSGTGKSTLLERTAGAWPHRLLRPPTDTPGPSVIDAMPGELERALRLLASAGLADTHLIGADPNTLSDGERFRLRLAISMANAVRSHERRQRTLLVIDEFASTLDRQSASALACTIGRLVRRTRGLSALIAGTRDRLAEPMRADLLVWCSAPDQIALHTPEREVA